MKCAIAATFLLFAAAAAAPALAQDPPAPRTPIQAANAEDFHVQTQLGAMVVTTSDSGSGLTPTLWADAEGPLAFGEGKSAGRIGARIGLTASPGQPFDGTPLANYKGVEVGLRLARVIGVIGNTRTSVRAEYSFTTLIKGATQARPQSGLSHSGGVGLSFQAKDSAAELTLLAAFDEATTTCTAPIRCTGLRSGFALVAYGQVPILDGKMLFAGDVSIATSPPIAGVQRYSVERVFTVIDPVQLFRGKPSP